MTDARWIEIETDLTNAVGHFEKSIALYELGGFNEAGIKSYQAEMALMHSLQSAHTSLENCFLGILEMLDEERPTGKNWHADLIRRIARELPGRRPAIVSETLAEAADETRCFRHRATHTYDSFESDDIVPTLDAAWI
ncbi:MAG: hypothetical protein FJX04_02605 [Alphaproteobacteria bacterium]|nr:hypothetical protein [Alphaproteobacteria bacterium]